MVLYDGQAVELVPVAKVPGRSVIFDAGRAEPFPDQFLPATQTFSLFPVDQDRASFGNVSSSHFFLPSIRMKRSGK